MRGPSAMVGPFRFGLATPSPQSLSPSNDLPWTGLDLDIRAGLTVPASAPDRPTGAWTEHTGVGN